MISIKSIKSYIPSDFFEVRTLVKDRILNENQYEKIGVKKVPVCKENEFPTDLMINAGSLLLAEIPEAKYEIGLVIAATVSPPEVAMRSGAARVIHELGLENAYGFDVFQGCNALSIQLDIAKSHLISHPDTKYVLLVAGDRWREFANNRYAAGLVFGDAGGAALVCRNEEGKSHLIYGETRTDASFHALAGLKFGTKYGFDPKTVYSVTDKHMLMNSYLPKNLSEISLLFDRILQKNGISKQQISFVHIPSGRLDLSHKILKHLDLTEKRSNLRLVIDHGDLGCVGPYHDLGVLLKESKRHDYGVFLTQGTGMFWSGWLIKISY